MIDDKGMTPLIVDFHIRVLLPCYRETPEMVRSSTSRRSIRICTRAEQSAVHWGSGQAVHPACMPIHTCKNRQLATEVSHIRPQIRTTVQAVLAAHIPPGCRRTVYVCDDGKDPVKRVRCVSSLLRHPSSVLRTLAVP